MQPSSPLSPSSPSFFGFPKASHAKMVMTSASIVAAATLAGVAAKSSVARNLLLKGVKKVARHTEVYSKISPMHTTYSTIGRDAVRNVRFSKIAERGKKQFFLNREYIQHVRHAIQGLREGVKQSRSKYMHGLYRFSRASAQFIEKNPLLVSATIGTIVEAGALSSLQSSYGGAESEADLHKVFSENISRIRQDANFLKKEIEETTGDIYRQIEECEDALNTSSMSSEKKLFLRQQLHRLWHMCEETERNEVAAVSSISHQLDETKEMADQQKRKVEEGGAAKEFVRLTSLSTASNAITSLMQKFRTSFSVAPLLSAMVVSCLDIVTHTDATLAKSMVYEEKAQSIRLKRPGEHSEGSNAKKITQPDIQDEAISKTIADCIKTHMGGKGGLLRQVASSAVASMTQDMTSGVIPKGESESIADRVLAPIAINLALHRESVRSTIHYYKSGLDNVRAEIASVVQRPRDRV